ncbi:uncharacterized protein B0J16DRAFT_414778 [Fusarium flagelliforme]|uniref:Uncharacterized protein n=1 Tax=Fusarium flagelliforme TaxID=2675880 RepID=A0A395MGY3_9HYPO|nr:uncharacterized protein B0J16DRAFT_414778 [Fusarium flagelliforme]KAH7185434.1 hypothetical protein B0J16DRAFT_414778 [Fusarium flagelliforme]RFN47162.1 hypothetical protein FIE12Z_8575 [Fusarium flagelliforme]
MHEPVVSSSKDHPPFRRQPRRSCRSKTATNGFYQDLDPHRESSEEADPAHPGTSNLGASIGIRTSQGPDRTQVQPASALGAREPDSQTVTNHNLRDRSTNFPHRPPVQPVPAVNIKKSPKGRFDDSDYNDDVEDDLTDNFGTLDNLELPVPSARQLRLRANTNFGPRDPPTSFPHRSPVQPVPAANVRKSLKGRFDDPDYEDDSRTTPKMTLRMT